MMPFNGINDLLKIDSILCQGYLNLVTIFGPGYMIWTRGQHCIVCPNKYYPQDYIDDRWEDLILENR